MKIAIITITCRDEPRFLEMARTIHAAGGDVTWIVVDDRLWYPSANDRRAQLATIAKENKLELVHIEPKPSAFRGPNVDEDLPDHNGARNTGVAEALAIGADYLLFLDDCTVISTNTIKVVEAAAATQNGLRVRIFNEKDAFTVPPTGKIHKHEEGAITFVPVSATTVAGGCFGVPAKAVLEAGGFDEIYGGEVGKEDIDLCLRVERLGYRFVTTRACAAMQILASHTYENVTQSDGAWRGVKNLDHWSALGADVKRTQPATPCRLGAMVEAAQREASSNRPSKRRTDNGAPSDVS